MIYNNITELIGNTPLLKINSAIHGLENFEVYAKLEYYNPFGSVKDRVAWSMLKPVLKDLIKSKKTVVEASSGNTAKALSILCSLYGLDFKTVTNRIKIPEIRMNLQLLGSQIEELPGLSDCPDPNDPNDFTTVAANLAKSNPDKYHYTDQYFNKQNFLAHFENTGPEILADLKKVDYFFSFLGTCGSSVGAGQYLKEQSQTKVIGVVASSGHHVPGGRNMSELWEVGLFKEIFFEDLAEGTTQDAIEGMLILNRKCGVLGGPTSGLNYQAMINYLKPFNDSAKEKRTAVFIVCDRVESYMSYIKKHKPEIFQKQISSRQAVENYAEIELIKTQKIDAASLYKKLNDCNIVDIRGNFAYSIAHIPGSVNILDELFSQIIEQGDSFSKDKELVIVCSEGKISPKYVAFLTNQGYTAFSLEDGFKTWKKLGLEVRKSI